MDRYLEANGRSDLALMHVLGVLNQFDKQVQFLVKVAVEDLKIPETSEGATILQFRRREEMPDLPPPSNPAA